ncbi:multicopper oxidase family protein [Salinisphaera hydrothermalis]|uniref:multicopper oxidase family protein n=1 Tax=Salinisphaera hydrothermalis TaxID=563188 RepID=UPI00333F01E6
MSRHDNDPDHPDSVANPTRRRLLQAAGLASAGGLAGALLPGSAAASSRQASASDGATAPQAPHGEADYTVRIDTGSIEVAPGRIVSTTTYNGQFPGPLLRFKEGRQTVVDIHNNTDIPEQLHWHGQFVPPYIDGVAEERTPFLTPHDMRREVFTPGPSGLRFYHSHIRAGNDLGRGTYSGQAGPVYIEPKNEPGNYDREVFLTLKEFEPFFSRGGDVAHSFLPASGVNPKLKTRGEAAMKASLAQGHEKGYEVGYRLFTVNGKMLGHGEPVRVKRGERVLFHVLNASATEIRSLALPGHQFQVVSLDGNPVPNPAKVPVLWLGTAERISAIVEMTEPGVWIMGDLSDEDRGNGMGIVVEYAGAQGKPQWKKPPHALWDYRNFAKSGATPTTPDEVIDLTFSKENAAYHGFNLWPVNGNAYDWQAKPVTRQLTLGKRYRLRMHNAADDIHPIHLHRNSFEITHFAGQATAGVTKDVVMLGGYQSMAIDFTANHPGLTLFHCHQQLHMDYGFMSLFEIV